MTRQKTVKIPMELFKDLIAYFIYHDHSERLYEDIRQAIDVKIDAMVERDLYVEEHGIIKTL